MKQRVEEPQEFCEVIDRIEQAGGESGRVSVGDMLDAVGRRSFGPMLLLPGIIAVSPLSGVPGMPTTLGCMVILAGGQILIGRKRIWLPGWILRRSISRERLEKGLRLLRKPARQVDRWLKPRWRTLAGGPAKYGIAALCVLIAATMPPLEVVPFAATAAGAALTAFGLALVAHDGLMVVGALLFTALAGVLGVVAID